MEMTITRALSELKMLDKRINRTVDEAVLGGLMIGKHIQHGFQHQEEIEKKAKADDQSIQALIKRRNAIKSAIVVSNATTTIDVAGVSMTVAEAIERKTSIEYDIRYLRKLKKVYTELVDKAEQSRTNQCRCKKEARPAFRNLVWKRRKNTSGCQPRDRQVVPR